MLVTPQKAGLDRGIPAKSPRRPALLLPPESGSGVRCPKLRGAQGAGWETGYPDAWQEGADRLPGTEEEPRGTQKCVRG